MNRCKYIEDGSKKYILIETYYDILHFAPSKEIRTEYYLFLPSGELIVQPGYEWDGPSGPAIDTKNFMDGSLVHDVLYEMIREQYLSFKYRKKADKELRIQCEKDGMIFPRRWWVWASVRIGGFFAALPKKSKILKAKNFIQGLVTNE